MNTIDIWIFNESMLYSSAKREDASLDLVSQAGSRVRVLGCTRVVQGSNEQRSLGEEEDFDAAGNSSGTPYK